MMVLRWLVILFGLIVVAIAIWASDKIGLQGERTVYSVRCEEGIWEGWRCTGRLMAGDRYRFRASRSRQEVIYWIVGSSGASGKYSECKVVDRGNWTCPEVRGQPVTVTHEMVKGHPVFRDGETELPFRAVAKWQWWLLAAGVQVTRQATE
jgi:hypothetical protein